MSIIFPRKDGAIDVTFTNVMVLKINLKVADLQIKIIIIYPIKARSVKLNKNMALLKAQLKINKAAMKSCT